MKLVICAVILSSVGSIVAQREDSPQHLDPAEDCIRRYAEASSWPQCAAAWTGPTLCGSSSVNQQDYRGTHSSTISGKGCQRWTEQLPHEHNRTPENYPGKGLDANYCRNPDNEPGGAWCYTDEKNTRWEYCGIPDCPTPQTRQDGYAYYKCNWHNDYISRKVYQIWAFLDGEGKPQSLVSTSVFIVDAPDYGMFKIPQGDFTKPGDVYVSHLFVGVKADGTHDAWHVRDPVDIDGLICDSMVSCWKKDSDAVDRLGDPYGNENCPEL